MTLIDHANRIAKVATPQERISYGPWKGSMRSVSADLVPPDYMAESDADTPSSNYAYNPLTGRWKRRKGQTQKFDSFASPVGMLPTKWSSKCRQLEEFKSASQTNGIPTVAALLTRETVTTGLDDGRFSTFWYRDQVADLNYTLGSEFSSSTYSVPGATEQVHKFIPLWYDSGDGGITRGANEYSRRFFLSGSRRFSQVGNWWYFPSFLGTPSRWSGTKSVVGATAQFGRPGSTVSNPGPIVWQDQGGGTTDIHLTIDDSPGSGDADYTSHSKQLNTVVFQFPAMSDPGVTTGHILRIRARVQPSSNGNEHLVVGLSVGGGASILTDGNIPGQVTGVWTGNAQVSPNSAEIGTSFTTYSYTLSSGEVALIGGDYSQFRVSFAYYTGYSAIETVNISSVELELPGAGGVTASTYGRLIPSGPIPPLHAGTLAAGTVVEDTTSYMRPDADVTDGSWLNSSGNATNNFSYIDDSTINDADYIVATNANTTCEVGLSDFGFTPAADEQIEVLYRATRAGTGTLTVYLMEGANIRASAVNTVITNSAYTYGFTLSATEVSSVTDWTNMRIQFITTGNSAGSILVSYAAVANYSTAATRGGWRGSDRFYYSMAYRFEDDSVWMPCTPRGPQTTSPASLPSGFNLFTVNSSNTSASYDSVIYSNLPIPPYGVKKKLILRSPKIDSRTDSTLQLNVRDLRVVAEVDAAVTSYIDTYADDDAPVLDVDQLFIRQDHIMPPRARYIFGGDSRVCHSYGSFNPSAIILAPVGRSADYDLNLADNAAALYTQNSFYVRIALDSSGVATLTLNESDGTTNTALSYALATYNTLEKLVDKINATSCAVDSQQWRAQIAPGADSQAVSTTALLPHFRTIDSCVVSGQTISKAAGGLSKVAVGSWISGTGATTGAYVSIINSDTLLTFVGTITAATKSLNFYQELGDAPTTGTANSGYQRVIANSLPGFLYFNKTYLNQFTTEKSTVWMTVASPGSIKSAANCFSGKTANKHTPPENIGISMGGAAVDNGFVVPFGNGNAAIRNTRDSGTGVDADYKLFILNESRGCCSPASIVAGNRFAAFFTPEGIVACELFNETLLSEAIWRHPQSDAVVGTGDFSYEAPLCIAATAADDDTAYLSARILRGALWINYRASGSHPNRQVVYDFSSGHESNGINALMKSPGEMWGWSVPLVRSVTALTEGRRADGAHLYGWNEANAGSTGDGRIDELETSDTDNGTAITASITTPWFEFGSDNLSAQEITAWHTSPTGATVALDFHRSRSDETYTLTPSTSSAAVIEDLKMLPLPARAVTDACYLGFRQSGGPAGELRKLELRAKRARDYK